ncbi:iron export ABC transporter permease subunit FetB [Anaerolineales bacterium HSG25]|nr:iron export ABC transporter permease subunit FetB [Anaerolineales bacterium HSG25]
MFETLAWLPRILGTLVLVGIAMGLSRWQQVDLEKDMLVAVARSFIQLIAIGYALDLIFSSTHPLWIGLVVAIMVTIAGHTAGQRGRHILHSQLIATSAVAVSAVVVLATLILLQVFPFEPRYIIPIAGMVVGNSMTAAGLTMSRLRDDIRSQHDKIEAALALGATQRQAVQIQLRRALRTGMTPIVDNTKTVGLISLPGAMTGMILAGASPLEAVQLQIIVMYMLIGAAAFSSLTATFLTYRQFFSRAHQLLLPDDNTT